MKTILRAAIAMTAMLATAGTGHAQSQGGTSIGDYPSRQVKIVVPFPAGGVADVVGRLLAQKLSEIPALLQTLRHQHCSGCAVAKRQPGAGSPGAGDAPGAGGRRATARG